MGARQPSHGGQDDQTISCVIPVHNGERYLDAAIESVLAQTLPVLEVIVVDDGSSDGSACVAGRYGDPVRVLRQPQAGQAAARNAGIAAARGEFVALLDADDLWHPTKLARQFERFVASPSLDATVAMAENFWEPDAAHEEARYRAAGKLRGAHHFSSLMTRRRILAETLPLRLDRASGDQLSWFLRAREAGLQIDVISDVLVYRRMHAASLSHTRETSAQYLELIKANLDRRRALAAARSDATREDI